MISRFFTYLFFSLIIPMALRAQSPESRSLSALAERIKPAPDEVFNKFREAGLQPVDHVLTAKEKDKVAKAFNMLSPLHSKILKQHLHSISFMDNMPNTALTSPVETADSTQKFNITFRAEIINETVSQWATWKENSYYTFPEDSGLKVTIDAGELDAMVYVLIHEATHVVDAVLALTPHSFESDTVAAPTAFTRGIWHAANVPEKAFMSPLLATTRFRSRKQVSVSDAPKIYKELQKTPFASLYSTAAWFEDLAELVAIYHLTAKLNQPFRVSVKQNSKEIMSFEPMKSKLVKKRLEQLKVFYD